MRIINKDPKLGISKVVWKFSSGPEEDKKPEPAPKAVEDEPVVSRSFEAEEEEPGASMSAQGQPEIRNDHIADLRQQINFLQQVIESQNQQLKTKDELLRNFQVLLKTEQEQVMKLDGGAVHKTNNESAANLELTWFQSLKRKLRKHER